MQTRGKKQTKEPRKGRKQKLPRAENLPTSEDELHGPAEEDPARAPENADVDDKALVQTCLDSKDAYAKARITMDALDDGGLPDPNQEIGTDMITTLAAAEQNMAEAEQALHTYWESIPPEMATALEVRFAAAHDLLMLLTSDRATAAAFARAADREHETLTEEDPPPDAQALQAAGAKVASARAIFVMRARAIDDFFRARESQAPREGVFATPKAKKAKKAKKTKKTAPEQQQPEEPTVQGAGRPQRERKSSATKAARQPDERGTPSARTPRRKTQARGEPPRPQSADDDTDGQMPALERDSSDDDDEEAGNRENQGERREEREHRGIPPTYYETTNDSDYVWEGDDDAQTEDKEDWGRQQQDKDYDYDQEFADDEADENAGIFAQGKVRSGYDYLKGAPELQFPSNAPQAAILERINVSAISHGMVIPVLRRAARKPMSFGSLLSPEAYYVVGPQGANMATTLTLGYAVKGTKDKTGQDHPACLIFPYRAGDHSVLALSDTAVAGEVLGPAAMHALSKNGTITLNAPSNPNRKPRESAGGQHGRAGDAPARKCDLMALQRALHHDRAKLAALTGNDPDMKATNPLLLTHIRNQQASTMIADLPIMQSTILPKLLQFNWCVTMDFSGPGKVADAVHPSHFLPRAPNGSLGTFKAIEDFRTWVDNIEAVCTAVFLEDHTSIPFFRRIWLRLRDQFRDTSAYGTVEHINKNFMAHELALICNKWAELYTSEGNINMSHDKFLAKNLEVLQFNQKEWRDNSRSIDISKIPVQRVGPPARDVQTPGQPPVAPPRAAHPRQQKRAAATPNPITQPPAKKQRGAPPPAQNGGAPRAAANAPNPAPAARQDSICLKHVLHAQDPIKFPMDCTQPAPCSRRHSVQLTAGKFSAPDKKAALAGLQSMKGTFAVNAAQYILTNM